MPPGDHELLLPAPLCRWAPVITLHIFATEEGDSALFFGPFSRDLSVARINWSSMGSRADRSKAEHALRNATGPVQRAIADNLQTRVTPRVHFHFDESLEKAPRVNEILNQLRKERGEDEEPAEGEDAESVDDTES